ncbi:MAG TPA: hypothetical protein VNF47_23195 [Streptosporangiaceae bacterium]|nr:hypothetical protein [Streptosporangiaceae bacterium]
MKLALAAVAVILAPGAPLTAYLAHLLRRDRAMIWHPGDDLPDVPGDAPIRTWHASPASPDPQPLRK